MMDNLPKFEVTERALCRPIRKTGLVTENAVVLTREEFVACYKAWIEPKNVAYICDGKKCPEEKASCLKGGPCHHTTDIDHAINFERIECGEKKLAKYFEHEHKFEGKADE